MNFPNDHVKSYDEEQQRLVAACACEMAVPSSASMRERDESSPTTRPSTAWNSRSVMT
jgi:hypothetical protein